MVIFVEKKESRIQCNFPTVGPNLYELCDNFALSSLSAFSEICLVSDYKARGQSRDVQESVVSCVQCGFIHEMVEMVTEHVRNQQSICHFINCFIML